MGRKILYTERDQITVTLDFKEKEAIRNAASLKGMQVSSFIRAVVLDRIAA